MDHLSGRMKTKQHFTRKVLRGKVQKISTEEILF